MYPQSFGLKSLVANYSDSEDEILLHENVQDVSLINQQENLNMVSLNSYHSTPDSSNSGVSVESDFRTMQQLVANENNAIISDGEGDLFTQKIMMPVAVESRPFSDDEDDDTFGVKIPPAPKGSCSVKLQERITKLYEKSKTGYDVNSFIQERKQFRNPCIYEKLIQFCDINEYSTNYPPDRYDPFKWGKESFYDELAKVQEDEIKKLEEELMGNIRCENLSRSAIHITPCDVTAKNRKPQQGHSDQMAKGVLGGHRTTAPDKSSSTFGSMKRRL